MQLPGMQQQGYLLRVPAVPPAQQTTARLLFPAGGRKNLRPKFQGLCQGMELVTNPTWTPVRIKPL